MVFADKMDHVEEKAGPTYEQGRNGRISPDGTEHRAASGETIEVCKPRRKIDNTNLPNNRDSNDNSPVCHMNMFSPIAALKVLPPP